MQAVDFGLLLLAAPPPAPEKPGLGIEFIVTIVIMLVAFFWLIQRPQGKEVEARKKVIEGLKKGDKVVFSGGIHGTVAKMHKEKDTAMVEIAKGVEIEVNKGALVIFQPPPPIIEKDSDGKDAKK